MNTTVFLETILRDYEGAIRKPKIARAVLFARSTFKDVFVSRVDAEIRGANGNWRAALHALPRSFVVVHEARLKKFTAWAEKVTRREVRGLLEWKGGAL